MRYVLGVDGGNSKTLAAVSEETGRILGVGRAGGSNHQAVGLDAALEEIRGAASCALRCGGVAAGSVDMAYFALAGADLPEDYALLQPAVRALGLGRRMAVENDSSAALRSGTDRRDAVVVVLGAGTVAAGRNVAGKTLRLPALGWISGDWGGGGDLAREAIRLSVRADDGRGRETTLKDMVLRAFGLANVDALIRGLYLEGESYLGKGGRPGLLALAPLVFEAADHGDAVAVELVERSGIEVATTAAALLRRLDLATADADVVLAGSLFKAPGPLLVDTVRERLRHLAPTARIVRPEVEPVIGSIFCAMDELDIAVSTQLRRTAAHSYRTLRDRGGDQCNVPSRQHTETNIKRP